MKIGDMGLGLDLGLDLRDWGKKEGGGRWRNSISARSDRFFF